MSFFLGIDTSAYTTSIALVDKQQKVIADERIILSVNKGNRGLRQSEALFVHLQNLPLLFERIFSVSHYRLNAIAVSAFPRRVLGSYMPVFNAGLSQARALSAFSGVPIYEVSHQEGHIMAGLSGNAELMDSKEFLAVHFSGGTSEIMLIERPKPGFIKVKTGLPGLDLHAGQLIDRIGVAIGLPFPAGQAMEKLALTAENQVLRIPAAVNDKGFSFSGAETGALRLLKRGESPDEVAFAVFRAIANTLEKGILKLANQVGIKPVLLVGGVMANSIIRARLQKRLEHKAIGMKLFFAEPHLSTDNAVGAALLAATQATRGCRGCPRIPDMR